jgi:hypothetical protein
VRRAPFRLPGAGLWRKTRPRRRAERRRITFPIRQCAFVADRDLVDRLAFTNS